MDKISDDSISLFSNILQGEMNDLFKIILFVNKTMTNDDNLQEENVKIQEIIEEKSNQPMLLENNVPVDNTETKNDEIDLLSDDETANDEIELSSEEIAEEIKLDDRITINVGGRKFNFKPSLLNLLCIDYKNLPLTKNNIYFLDRDPNNLMTVITMLKNTDMDKEKLKKAIDEFDEPKKSIIKHEMFLYNVWDELNEVMVEIDPVSCERGEITMVESNQDIVFETTVFGSNNNIGKFNAYPLRHVINFLRFGKYYYMDDEMRFILKSMKIKYKNLKSIKTIVSNYQTSEEDAVAFQFMTRTSIFNGEDAKPNLIDNGLYNPDAMRASLTTEMMDIISTDSSSLKFNTDIEYIIEDSIEDLMNDIILCVDIMKIDYDDAIKNGIGYSLLKYIEVYVFSPDTSSEILLLRTTGDRLRLDSVIYSENSNVYNRMASLTDDMQILYEDNLIDLYRITLPLFFFRDIKSFIPIRKIINRGMKMKIKLNINAPTGHIDSPLLNAFFMVNGVVLPYQCFIRNEVTKVNEYKQINSHFVSVPFLYSFRLAKEIIIKSDTIDLMINPPTGDNIIDFFFVTADDSNKYEDNLVQMEIFVGPEKKFFGRADTMMLSTYLPLKRLGHVLPRGVYYYSFSPTPQRSENNGSIMSNGLTIKLKMRRMSTVKFYYNVINDLIL